MPCDLRDIVAGAVDSLPDASVQRLTIEVDARSSHVVLAEASRLERVVTNLLTNALKYSAATAPVKVRLSGDGRLVELEVVDRGIGIPPESLKRLFERYYRAAGGKASAGGLGLGLYIARLIVEAHSGQLSVASELGRGSTFKLELPSYAGPQPHDGSPQL